VNHHCSWIDFKNINQPIEGNGNTNVKRSNAYTSNKRKNNSFGKLDYDKKYPSLDLNMIISNTNETAPKKNCSLQNV
jgi:hypothetical protein